MSIRRTKTSSPPRPEMDCRRFERHLPVLCGLEGEGSCSPELFAALAEHETECAACARGLAAYRLTVELIRALASRRNRGRA